MNLAEATTATSESGHDSRRLEAVFNRCFVTHYRTRLVGGAPEPLYQPARDPEDWHTLSYRNDYFASALHEVAHWCLAGETRRQQVDFGYWYTPDNRSLEQQRAFEAVEYRPQTLEWFFAKACGFRFQVSADNLALSRRGELNTVAFKVRVLEQTQAWRDGSLPPRGLTYFQALCGEFGTALLPAQLDFRLSEIA